MVVNREQQGKEFERSQRWLRRKAKQFIGHGELMKMSFPPNKWAVEQLIPADGITILSAPPGSYKTWLLLDVIIGVASGKDLFGKFKTMQSTVLVIDEENGPRLIQDRLDLLGAGDKLPIQYMFSTDFQINEKSILRLLELCKEYDIKFVTIDSLIRVHAGNENDAVEMAKVFRHLRKLTMAGITLLITHHNRKGNGKNSNSAQEMRGSSDILAALDCQLSLVRDDDRLKLIQNKVRFTEELDPLDISIKKNGELVSFVYEGVLKQPESRTKLIRAAIVEVLDERLQGNQNEVLEWLREKGIDTSINTLREALNQLFNDGTITKEKGERNSFLFKLTT